MSPRRPGLKSTWLALSLVCNTVGATTVAGNDSPGYELSLAHPTVHQLVGADVASPRTQSFVWIEVTQVRNPQRIPLSFEVGFQPGQGEKIRLGSFSLYPPDHPGRFIVATGGKLQAGGTVSVTLVPLQRAGDEARIRVRLARLTFRAN